MIVSAESRTEFTIGFVGSTTCPGPWSSHNVAFWEYGAFFVAYKTWEQLGNKTCRIPCYTVRLGAGKSQSIQQHAIPRFNSGSENLGSTPSLPAIPLLFVRSIAIDASHSETKTPPRPTQRKRSGMPCRKEAQTPSERSESRGATPPIRRNGRWESKGLLSRNAELP